METLKELKEQLAIAKDLKAKKKEEYDAVDLEINKINDKIISVWMADNPDFCGHTYKMTCKFSGVIQYIKILSQDLTNNRPPNSYYAEWIRFDYNDEHEIIAIEKFKDMSILLIYDGENMFVDGIASYLEEISKDDYNHVCNYFFKENHPKTIEDIKL